MPDISIFFPDSIERDEIKDDAYDSLLQLLIDEMILPTMVDCDRPEIALLLKSCLLRVASSTGKATYRLTGTAALKNAMIDSINANGDQCIEVVIDVGALRFPPSVIT